MTVILPKDVQTTFMVGFNHSPTRIDAGCYAGLPGATPFNQLYQCDPRVPEEMAALYDDLMHDSAIWLGLWQRALTDICTFQVPLF